MSAADVEAGLAEGDRWIWSHVVLAFGFGLMVAAIHAIVNYLHEAGERNWSSLAMLLGAVGGVGYGLLVGAEGLAARVAVDAGATVEGLIDGYEAWFGVFAASALLFSLSALSLAVSIWRSHALTSPETRWCAIGFLAATAVVSLVPFGWAGIAASAFATLSFGAVSYEMWRHASPATMMRAAPTPA